LNEGRAIVIFEKAVKNIGDMVAFQKHHHHHEAYLGNAYRYITSNSYTNTQIILTLSSVGP
jgi:hypothetical protein